MSNDDVQKFLSNLRRDRLALFHRVISSSDRKDKRPSPQFLQMLAEHPEFAKDRERPGTLVVPKHLKFTHRSGNTVLKTALLKADIPHYKNEASNQTPEAYISINYAALAKFFPDMAGKSFRNKRFAVEFEQHRCPSVILKLDNLDSLQAYMEQLENVVVYFLARFGAEKRKLQRTADGELVMPFSPNPENVQTLRNVYKRSLNYRPFAAYGENDQIPFGIVTRNILPSFCRMIDLHYRYEGTTRTCTSFAFPMLEIGVMNFYMANDHTGAQYQRVTKVNGREKIQYDGVTTGDWLRHELYEMLSGPLREMELLREDIMNSFDNMVNEIRSILKAGPFKPSKLTPAHEALIQRAN